MSVLLQNPIRRLSQEDFHGLDYRVMDIVFKMHNELGRHLDEKIYERELAYRLSAAGIQAQMQVPLGLYFEDYKTTLFVDLLVEGSTIYELKAGSALAPAHRAQALSYLFLTDTRHGKLVNLGTPRVEHEFVSTSLSFDDRRQFEIVDRKWIASGNAGRLREFIIALARDWGVFLECSIYRNAVVHCFEGEQKVHLPVELFYEGRSLGAQEMDLIDADSLFAITAFKEDLGGIRAHFVRTLHLARLRCLHWINFNKRSLEFESLVDT